MPTYEYECTECKHRFDVFQKMSDEPVKECVKCTGSVRRVINGGSGIIFKGSGFYVNDYKKDTKCGSSSSADSPKQSESCAACSAADSCGA